MTTHRFLRPLRVLLRVFARHSNPQRPRRAALVPVPASTRRYPAAVAGGRER